MSKNISMKHKGTNTRNTRGRFSVFFGQALFASEVMFSFVIRRICSE